MYLSALLADPSLLHFRAHPPRSRTDMGGRRGARNRPRETRGARRRGFRWSWLVVAAVIAVAIGGLTYLRVWPPLATVMSASMSPTIKTGDIVVLKKLEGPAQIGDIVAISVPENIRTRYGYPPVIIHRVVSIDADDVVTTKGDAYKEADPFDVPRSALTTKVVATVPAAGRALGFLGSGLGLAWLAGGVLLFVGMPLLERQRDARRREDGERESLQVTLRGVTEELALLRDEPPAREDDASEVVAELRLLVAETTARESAMVAELGTLLAQRDAIAAEERRAERAAAAAREAALAEELRAERDAAAAREAAAAQELRAANARATETLQAMTVSFTESLEAANRRAEAAEAQLQAHLDQLPAQIERAVALALASHTPAPPPPAPPAPARSGRFVAASDWPQTAAWDAPAPLAT